MTQFLPPNLLALFAPRDPVPYLPPPDKLTHEKKRVPYMGIAQYAHLFEDPKDTPPPTRAETREERRERKRREKAEQVAYKLEQEIAMWDPHSSSASTMDPFKTLFVARINYDTSESKLRREFEVYGAVRKIVMVHDKRTAAYKHADGKKIDGRRVLVDVERARTVKGWLPRRLGGGLGGTRRGGPEVNVKHSGREDNERERQRYLDRERDRENGREGRDGRDGREARDRERPFAADRGDRDRDRERDRDRDRDRDRAEKRRSRSRDKDRERRKRSRSRDRKRARRSEERMDASVAGSEGNAPVTSGDERRRDKERDKDKDRRERRDRDKDRGKERDKDRDKDRERKRSRRSRSRERRDRDKERERRDFPPREDDVDQIRVKEEPPDEYEQYQPQEYDEYNNYDPNNIKYEGDEPHFQAEEY